MLRNEDKRLNLGNLLERDVFEGFPSYLAPGAGVLTLLGPDSLVSDITLMAGSAYASSAWPAANRAIYIPFVVEIACTAYQIGWENGATVNNGVNDMDVGIYDEAGNRLVSQGGTITQTPINSIQLADITDTVLVPALYYLAMCVSNTTGTYFRSSANAVLSQMTGVQQQAVGAVALPGPATFANPASGYLPLMSIAMKATI